MSNTLSSRNFGEETLGANPVSVDPFANHMNDRDVGDIGKVAKCFAGRHVRNVNFGHRQRHRGQGISKHYRSVGQTARVYDNSVAVLARLVNRVDQHAFVVALDRTHLKTVDGGSLRNQSLDIGQRLRSVNLGLTRPEQVQVGPVYQQQAAIRHLLTVPVGATSVADFAGGSALAWIPKFTNPSYDEPAANYQNSQDHQPLEPVGIWLNHMPVLAEGVTRPHKDRVPDKTARSREEEEYAEVHPLDAGRQ